MLTKAPKGTKDILPSEVYKWQYVEQAFAEICRRHGFGEIRTPDFEHTELFKRGVGGTTDIGMGCLSGMFDRNDDVLYICYDNEAYMNTGIQQSSLTPYGASTTTSPVDRNGQATLTQKKDMFRIVSAMGAPYVATASVGYLDDYATKVEKASHIHGTKFIHVLAPCPTGWGSPVDATVELAREATAASAGRRSRGVCRDGRDEKKEERRVRVP